jgi:hypothetical protein
VVWLLSLRLPARRPLGPRASVVIRELVDDDDEVAAVAGRATRKPLATRTRLAVAWVSSFNALSVLRFDMRGGWKERTRVHQSAR